MRYYFALTNFCNRTCDFCCCSSGPNKKAFLPFEELKNVLREESYEIQLEGGEPTLHPDFYKIVEYASSDDRCKKIILCTNGTTVPKDINIWLKKFSFKPFVLKPSINSHLIKKDKSHVSKMVLLKDAFIKYPWRFESKLIFNVRRIPKPLSKDGEEWITKLIKENGLEEFSNNWEFQRYGRGAKEGGLSLPFVVENPISFKLISPDGKDFNCDLIKRALHMETLK